MSGGVDSSVTAALLAEQGHDVVGVTMKLHEDGADLPDRPCCSLDSANDARRVAERLGIPHYVVDLVDAFRRDVLDDFVREHAAGRTPIPCVRCNTFTKFRDLVRKADAIDAPLVATGHYARLADGALWRGADAAKDQSYFLWGIPRAVLPRLLLPVGGMSKAETRAHARRFGLTTAEKPESQDLCFVPGGDHVAVVRERLGADHAAFQPGAVVTAAGTVVGEHDGYAGFTVGQRRGLPGGARAPLFVLEVRPDAREVVVGPRDALARDRVRATEVHWLAAPSRPGDAVTVQVRHRAAPVQATVTRADDVLEVALATPVQGVAPGQSLVLYDGDRVLGGGVIGEAERLRGGEAEDGASVPAPTSKGGAPRSVASLGSQG
jgi:tRNA-specific 2-thiouridylase